MCAPDARALQDGKTMIITTLITSHRESVHSWHFLCNVHSPASSTSPSNVMRCCCFHVRHVSNSSRFFSWFHVVCTVCLFCLSANLCVYVSRHHVRGSVTKHRKAHLKRLDRRWTLGGMVSRQQSRGDQRQGAELLLLLYCSSFYSLKSHFPEPTVPCPVLSFIPDA